MRKKTTSEIICQNFKLSTNETIFQDYKCTLKASVTFFGRLYIGEEHFLFISNMFGIVKKCIIQIQRVKKVEIVSNGTVLVVQSHKQNKQGKDLKDNHPDCQYTFGSFKNDNAFKLMQALWKRQKIVGDILKAEDEQMFPNDAIMQNSKQNPSNAKVMMEEGKVEANFFNYQTVENERQKVVEIVLPCSVQQYYNYFLANKADVYPRKKHLQMKGAQSVVVSDWRKSEELNSEVRELAASLKVSIPFRNYAPLGQVWMLKIFPKGQLQLGVVSSLGEVPYSSYFTVHEHITVNAINQDYSRSKCVMCVHCSIVFNKSTYMKNTILNRTMADLKEDYAIWIKNVEQIIDKIRKKNEDEVRMSRASSSQNWEIQQKNSNSGKSQILDKTFGGISQINEKTMVREREEQVQDSSHQLQFEPVYKNGAKIILQNIKKLSSGNKLNVNEQPQKLIPISSLLSLQRQITFIKQIVVALLIINFIQLVLSFY